VFEPAAEAMSTDERATLQLGALRGLVDRLLAKDGLQGRRLKDAGIGAAADVDDLSTLPALPTTSKRDLWDAYPFGMLAVPREEVVAVHGSSGTGGRPTLVGYTRADLRLWSRMCARALAAAGATPESVASASIRVASHSAPPCCRCPQGRPNGS
jgi:phenylacetate-coenzyme A ligase PaaK-like adenylate-forming protein